jgi:hypothetical protein
MIIEIPVVVTPSVWLATIENLCHAQTRSLPALQSSDLLFCGRQHRLRI